MTTSRRWDDATPDEIRDARIQSLEEGLEHLKQCVEEAFGVCVTQVPDVRPETILDEEWTK